MVQYRDLNAPPSRMLADVVADMKAQERQSKTGDAGVKDLGEAGDIVWPRWDGGEDSVREVSVTVRSPSPRPLSAQEPVLRPPRAPVPRSPAARTARTVATAPVGAERPPAEAAADRKSVV